MKTIKFMKTIKLSELEKRIKENSEKNAKIVRKFESEVSKLTLKKGRVRPRDKDEQKILDSFNSK